MKWRAIFFCCILFISCKEKEESTSLVLDNLQFFSLYDTTCETWLEQKFSCSTDSCFSSAAVEIVGIDTSNMDSIKVYAWAWNEHFVEKNNKSYSGNKKLLISRFTINPVNRKLLITDVFIPEEDHPLEEQLEAEKFPKSIIETYFTKQPENVEKIRIQALTQKATAKYKLYQKNIFKPDTSKVYLEDSLVSKDDTSAANL